MDSRGSCGRVSGWQCPRAKDTVAPIAPAATLRAAADKDPSKDLAAHRASTQTPCSSPNLRGSSTRQRLHRLPGDATTGSSGARRSRGALGRFKSRRTFRSLGDITGSPIESREGFNSLAEPPLPKPQGGSRSGRGDSNLSPARVHTTFLYISLNPR